jgi:hypothetical protein
MCNKYDCLSYNKILYAHGITDLQELYFNNYIKHNNNTKVT